jgi:putative transcriptional regulator
MKTAPIIPSDPSDPEDFDTGVQALDRAQKSRLIRKTRTDMKLSQAQFAKKFKVPLGTLRDWEQARSTPPDFAVAYIRVIEKAPDVVAKAVA